MQDRPVSAGQLAVLKWIVGGAKIGEEPSESYKISAVALNGRGLITLRKSPSWTASITERGSYYLAHCTYPPRASRSATNIAAESQAPSGALATRRRRPTPEVALETDVDEPHRVIRAAARNPSRRLGFSDEMNMRCLLISQTLLREAETRGFKITSGWAERPTSSDGQWPVGTGALFHLDAGHEPVGIGFSIRHRQVDRPLSPEDAERKARGSWIWGPRFSYEPTDVLRIDLYISAARDYRMEDGAYPVEDRLHVILKRVPLASERAIAAAETARIRKIEAAAAAEQARIEQQLRSDYDRWLSLLQAQHEAWKYHHSLATYVDDLLSAAKALEPGQDRDRALAYAEWARELIDATDPVGGGMRIPSSDIPRLAHRDRFGRETLADPSAGRAAGRFYGW